MTANSHSALAMSDSTGLPELLSWFFADLGFHDESGQQVERLQVRASLNRRVRACVPMA